MNGFYSGSSGRCKIIFRERSAIWLSIIAACILAAGCSRNPQVVKQKYLDKGHSYFIAGKYREAIIEYENAIQVDPKLAQAHYELAECYLKQGNWRDAYEELGRDDRTSAE